MKDKKFKVKFHLPIGLPASNGRVYSKRSMEKAIKSFNENQNHSILVKDNRALGTTWAGTVEDMAIKDEHVVADVVTIDTPIGRQLQSMLEEGLPVSFVPEFESSGSISSVGMVYRNDVDEDTYETIMVLYESINSRIDELGLEMTVKVHEGRRIYVIFNKPESDIVGYWLYYDPKTNKMSVTTTDIEVDMHDPSSVDRLVHSLDELRKR